MKKALIVRLSSLGDVVLTSVVIDPLIEKGFKPYILTFKPYDEIFEDDWRVTPIGVEKRDLFKKETLEDLKEHRFSLFIDLHKNLKTLRLRLVLGGRWVSYKKDSLRRRLAVRFPKFRTPYYVTESYLRAIGITDSRHLPRVEVSQERLEKLSEILPKEKFVVIGAGARYKKKAYPRYRELADLIRKAGFEVVWVGDEKDREVLGEVEGVNLCGDLRIPDVMGVIKLADVFVGNDSGLLHCARAVGTPAVQIYGGTHPTLGFSLYPEEGRVILKSLECQPCDIHGKGECRRGDLSCLDIDPSHVFSEMLSLVSERS